MKYAIEDRRVVCKGDYYIAPGAIVIGSVILEPNVSIWFNCVVRADNDIITLGEGSLIGIGAILLNHCRIGKHCLVGAGTLIPEGKEFPDGKLILGSPGKVVRDLTPQEIERIGRTALNYQQRAKRYRAGLKPDGE